MSDEAFFLDDAHGGSDAGLCLLFAEWLEGRGEVPLLAGYFRRAAQGSLAPPQAWSLLGVFRAGQQLRRWQTNNAAADRLRAALGAELRRLAGPSSG